MKKEKEIQDEERRGNSEKLSIPWEKLYPEPAQHALNSNQSILAERYPPMQ